MSQEVTVAGLVGDGYSFEVDPDVWYETYSCESYTGIKFRDPQGNKFDVVLNPHFGPRLIFNLVGGSWNDVPFKQQTFGFLPSGVRVRSR